MHEYLGIPKFNVVIYDSETGETHRVHNTVTLTHRERYAEFLAGYDISPPNHIAIGYGRAADNADQAGFTEMISETARVPFEGGSVSGSYTARIPAVVPANVGIGEINEIGLFDSGADVFQISDCDSLDGWSGAGTSADPRPSSLSIRTSDRREGTGSLYVVQSYRATADDIDESQFARYTLTAERREAAVEALNNIAFSDLKLQFWLRTSDPEGLAGTYGDLSVRLRFGDGFIEWNGITPPTTSGWTHFSLPLTSATIRANAGTSFSLASATAEGLRDFRFAARTATGSRTHYIDDIRLFNSKGSLWAWAQTPTTITKTDTSILVVSWFITVADSDHRGTDLEPYLTEDINVITTARGFTSSSIQPQPSDTEARQVSVYVRSGSVRYTLGSGQSPSRSGSSTTFGPVGPGGSFNVVGDDVRNFRVIRDASSSSGSIRCVYFR